MFETGPERTIDVMILAGEAVLSVIVQGVEFVAPFAREVEPRGWSIGRSVRRAERVCDVVVGVCEGVEGGIPERAAVRFVVEDAEGEDVRVGTWRGVHGVCADCGVYDRLSYVSWWDELEIIFITYSNPDLLHGRVLIS